MVLWSRRQGMFGQQSSKCEDYLGFEILESIYGTLQPRDTESECQDLYITILVSLTYYYHITIILWYPMIKSHFFLSSLHCHKD